MGDRGDAVLRLNGGESPTANSAISSTQYKSDIIGYPASFNFKCATIFVLHLVDNVFALSCH